MSIVVHNFAQIGGFLYFGGHFGFKMAAIANRNGRNMGQHVLLPVNIHFHWNLLILEFLTIFLKKKILAVILKWRPFLKFKNKKHLRKMCQTNFWRKKERRKRRTRNDMIWRIINGSQFQKLWWISIHKNKIYLEPKFFSNRRILYFGGHFGFKMAAIANQIGRHMCSMSYSL